MAQFEYVIEDKAKKRYRGNIEADNETSATEKLKEMGFSVFLLKKKHQKFSFFGSRIKIEDLMIFTERLSVMISAGLPLTRSLQAISNQIENDNLKKVLNTIRFDLESGGTFSGALANHPQIFSTLYVNLVKAGEEGGIIDVVLQRISDYLNKNYNLSYNIKKAFSYPAIVLFVAGIVVSFLMVFIVPVFSKSYALMNLTLPIPTILLINISNFIKKFWVIIILLLFLLFLLFQIGKKSKPIKNIFDLCALKTPVLGRLVIKIEVSRFIRTLGMLIASGVGLIEALEVSKEVIDNSLIIKVVSDIQKEVKDGGNLTYSLSKEKIFEPMVVQMIASGEESGTLDKMLKKTADFLERELEMMLQKLVIRLEPILTFSLALIVGFIALAIYLPMFDLISAINK